MAKHLQFTVTNPVGLYATPTTELVDLVKNFTSQVTLCYGEKKVNLKSRWRSYHLAYQRKQILKSLLMDLMKIWHC